MNFPVSLHVSGSREALPAPEGFCSVVEGLRLLPGLGSSEGLRLEALGKERDAGIFWEGLRRFSHQLQRKDKLEAAAAIYGLVKDQASEASTRARASRNLDAIEGRGAVGARVEFLLSRFAKDSTDPRMIAPMLAGTAVYQLAKGAALGRMALAARATWWMRGLPGRLAASSFAYAAEVPAFALTGRALRGLSSEPGTEPGLGTELSGAAITLGLLKLGGAGSRALLAKSGVSVSPLGRLALSQGTMFGSLWAAHRLEAGLGLRPHAPDDATEVTDILSSMASLGLGASLGHKVLGPRYTARLGELERRMALSPEAGVGTKMGSGKSTHSASSSPVGPDRLPAAKWAAAAALPIFLSPTIAEAALNGVSFGAGPDVWAALATLGIGTFGALGMSFLKPESPKSSRETKDLIGIELEETLVELAATGEGPRSQASAELLKAITENFPKPEESDISKKILTLEQAIHRFIPRENHLMAYQTLVFSLGRWGRFAEAEGLLRDGKILARLWPKQADPHPKESEDLIRVALAICAFDYGGREGVAHPFHHLAHLEPMDWEYPLSTFLDKVLQNGEAQDAVSQFEELAQAFSWREPNPTFLSALRQLFSIRLRQQIRNRRSESD